MTKAKWIEILSPYYPDYLIEALWLVKPENMNISEERLLEAAKRFSPMKES